MAEFHFKHSYIDADLPEGRYAQTVFADIDGDGVPEFITGQQYGDLFWYDRDENGVWQRFLLGEASPSDVGAAAYDVDGDGHIDLITGGAWYKNPGDPRKAAFQKIVFDPELTGVHDLVLADINGDGRIEVVTMSDQNNLRFYEIPADPTMPWIRRDVASSVHAGVSVGDINGDGHLDIVRTDVWLENVRGDGSEWVEHPLGHFGGHSGWEENATLSHVCDINGDGKNDIVLAEAEITGARIFWLENVNGDGLTWVKHVLPHSDDVPRGAYHTLVVTDFTGSGSLDIFSCEMEAVPGEKSPRFFIWENTDGKGTFAERVILNNGLGGHMALACDLNGTGRLDIVSKTWYPRPDNANGGRAHVDFLENLG